MLITLGSSTDVGKRETNQDSVLAVLAQNLLPRKQSGGGPAPARVDARVSAALAEAAAYVQSSALLILADGMGGRSSGQLASETATKSVYRELAHTLAMQEGVDNAYLEKSLDNAIQQANNRIHQLAAKQADAEGMGTTCTAALVMRDLICLGHVGDSRAYLLTSVETDASTDMAHSSSRLKQLTSDHSVVAGEVRAGRLTEEEARSSRFRNVITRAVGVDLDVEPEVITYTVPRGSISHLILSSDGLHGSVEPVEIESIVRHHARSPQRAANALVAAAKRGGANDNISVIVARIDATGENYREGSAPVGFGAEEDEAAAESSGAQGRRAKVSGEGFWTRSIIWQIGCAALAAAAVAAWFVPGLFRPATQARSPMKPPAPTLIAPAAPPNLAAMSYGAPQTLLPGRVLAPSVLQLLPGAAPAQGDLMVVDPKANRLLRIRSSDGLVATSVPEPSTYGKPEDDLSSYEPMAADASGDAYLFAVQSGKAEIRKYDAEGKFLASIARGQLHRPTAVAVVPSGDLFLIDDGALKRIPASVNAAATATNP